MTAYVLHAVRTPRGRGKRGKGSPTGIRPQELLAQSLNGLAERTGIDRAEVDDVVVGGGVESTSRVPIDAGGGEGYGLNPRLRETHFQVPQGIATIIERA